jgi:hypothetical protein
MFKKATKEKSKLRILFEGASGSGKTYSSLVLASGFNEKIAVIDTEKGSASLYSSEFDFDVCELSPPYTPESYTSTIKLAESEGYGIIIIDSITQEWSGPGGCLDIQSNLGGQYRDWAKVTPRHNKFIESILQSKCHIVATARTKADYVVETNSKGKSAPKKVGLKTEQRDGLDFEFTSVLRLNENHMFESTKDRTHLFDGKDGIVTKEHSHLLLSWLNEGIEKVVPEEKEKEPERIFQLKKIDSMPDFNFEDGVDNKKDIEDAITLIINAGSMHTLKEIYESLDKKIRNNKDIEKAKNDRKKELSMHFV